MNKSKLTLLLLALLLGSFTSMSQVVVTSQVSASSDDSEEQGSNGTSPGTIDITSTDLELVVDGGDSNQYVGIRFGNLNIPQGAFIESAYIQFTVDETDADSTSVVIQIEDVVNASTFGTGSFDISNRTAIGAVLWEDIPAWNTVGQAGPDQRTPDLSGLIQNKVYETSWASGNAINFIITGVGQRTAESFDGSASEAPTLVVEFYIPTEVNVQVSSSNDDAEEQGSNGSSPGTIDLTSSDLELIKDGGDGNQYVGIRFGQVEVPAEVQIAYAYLQFTVDETELDSTSVWIKAEEGLAPQTYNGTNFEISSRTVVADSVLWEDIPVWSNIGQASADQRTPNLASLVQYLVDQNGWTSGNAMNFIITGIGQRTAESYDGSLADAAQLIIGYIPEVAPLGVFPIDSGTIWAYNDSGIALSTSWVDTAYNDSSWAFGPAELGYGDGGELTILDYGPSASNKYPTYYFRQNFEASNVAEWDSLKLFLKHDDGAVVYLNGQEVYRVNLPVGPITYNTLALSAIGGVQESQFVEVNIENLLVDGFNTVAVEMHQNAVTSSDLSFDLRLEAILPPLNVDTFPLASGAGWYYLDDGSNQDTAWRAFTFEPYDAGWAQGAAQLGYGDNDEQTVIGYGPNPNDKYITSYFYKEFYIDTVGVGDTILLGLLRDDGAAVYLNGELIVLDNLPTVYDYTTWSNVIVSGQDENTFFEFLIPTSSFNQGLNSIAVEIHQRDGTSSDKSFDLLLDIVPEPPVAGSGCTNGVLNHIGCFTSIDAIGQTQYLTIPESHAFQVIFQQGEQYDNFNGVAPGNNDFTGYVPINGSSVEGYVAVNHETTPGGVSILDVHYDAPNRVWIKDSLNRVDMYNNSVVSTTRNCSGGVTPWGTTISSEETYNTGDANNDGYEDVGWNVEIDPATREVVNQEKLWALGRMAHENVVVAKDSIRVYQGEDGGSSCVFKFIADVPGDLSSGDLYVLKLDAPLFGGDPSGTTAQWIAVPNVTQSDRNNTRSLATSLGGTNFNGVEDCEISPIDNKIYFTSKGNNRVYRFTDLGATVSNFETFVGGTSYSINIGSTVINESWGSGNDNLDFDDLGNLWVNQDGSQNYIWMVRPDHTQSNPKVELFGSTPNGSESTGITFTPDAKFIFMSIQHPSGSNGSFNDVTGETFAFDRSTTVVIARKEYLGQYGPTTQAFDAEVSNAQNCETIDLSWTLGDGSRRMVIAKEGSAVDAFPVDGVWYNADQTFGLGDDLGGGNYIVYDGISNAETILGLDGQNEYHFAVVEYNEQFGSVFYQNDNPAETSFEFDAAAVEVITGVDSSEVGEIEVYSINGNAGYDYNWTVTGGNLLAGQSTNTITVEWLAFGTQNLSYTPTTSEGCEGSTSELLVNVKDTAEGVGIANRIDAGVRIYPNPTSGLTVIEYANSNKVVNIAVYDVHGKEIRSVFVTNGDKSQFDASALNAGIYIVKIEFESSESITQQLVVQ